MTDAKELEDLILEYFKDNCTEGQLRRRELTFAEVEVLSEEDEAGRVEVREVSRGHFVHKDWPALAKEAASKTQRDLLISKRFYSKRVKSTSSMSV